jgi:hypothetical protein
MAEVEEVVTVTARCEAGLCGGCRGLVLSLTGNRKCEHACHDEEGS